MPARKSKPRVRFCWACSRKLRGNHHGAYPGTIDDVAAFLATQEPRR
jgi:hypothetical protein